MSLIASSASSMYKAVSDWFAPTPVSSADLELAMRPPMKNDQLSLGQLRNENELKALNKLFDWLDPRSLQICAAVCRKWKEVMLYRSPHNFYELIAVLQQPVLEIIDVLKCAQVCKRWNKAATSHTLWLAIVKRMHPGPTSDLRIASVKQSKSLIRLGNDLRNVAEKLQIISKERLRVPRGLGVGAGIVPYLADYRLKRSEEAQKTQAWFKAYSTLMVWSELACSMNVSIDFSVESYLTQSPDSAIAKAAEFLEWCKQNRAGLATVTKLELKDPLMTFLPPVIFILPNLVHLDLYRSQVRVPREIGKLTQLTFLGLSSIGLTSLPIEITQLSQLTTLHLSFNRLTKLPKGFENLSRLRTLSLIGEHNEFTELPDLSKLWLYPDSRREYNNEIDYMRSR